MSSSAIKMEMPISRGAAYIKRNRTTHSWYGDGGQGFGLMSTSMPCARTLEDHMRRSRRHFATRGQSSMTKSFHVGSESGTTDLKASPRKKPSKAESDSVDGRPAVIQSSGKGMYKANFCNGYE